MSYTSIPNQPIIFNSTLSEPCPNCNTDYNQVLDFNDQVFFQLEAGQCGYLQFDSVISNIGCTIENSTITFPDSAGDQGVVFGYKKFINCLEFKLTITIDSDMTGVLTVGFTNGTTEQISAPGTHEIYLKATDIPANTNNNIQDLILASTGANGFVGTVTIMDFQPYCNGALFVGLVDPVTLSVVERFDPVITTSDQYLTAAIDLKDYELEAGCYRLAIADFCTNTCGQYYVYNPYFNDWGGCLGCPTVGWANDYSTGTDDWTVGGGTASISYTANANATYLESITELCEGAEYSVTIIVDSINDGILKVVVNQLAEGINITAAGTYTFNIIPASSGKIGLFLINNIGQTADVVVSKLDIRAYKEHAVYDKYTDEIQIGDFSDDCKYFKIEGCNAENQFGLGFNGTSFLPGVRLEGRKFRAQYDVSADIFRYASGKTVTSYADVRKRWTFYFERMPEHILDFMSIIFYFDNVYINGEVYAPFDSSFPDIEYNDADNLGSLTIELIKKDTLVRKAVCVAADANCLPSILDLGSEPFILAQDGDRLLTQDNINLYQQ
jgi:hypothetical protein